MKLIVFFVLFLGAQQSDQRQFVPLQRIGPQEDAGRRSSRQVWIHRHLQEEQVPGEKNGALREF